VSGRGLLRRAEPAIDERIDALGKAVAIATGRLDDDEVERARAVLERASERLGLGLHHTVVALAGPTGSGKSSLFNRLVGKELSPVGVRRPTTGSARACVWGESDAGPLLDWLGAATRHRLGDVEAELDGLVLLDLPDYDSVEMAHRIEVDRILELVDLLVWVLDPQKYADAALHEGYLRPLAAYDEVMLVALNQVDRLDPSARRRCRTHLQGLLTDDGLGSVPVLTTSAATGEGVLDLSSALTKRVAARRAAVERLSADLEDAARALSAGCGSAQDDRGPRKAEWESLVASFGAAAGVEPVAQAVGRAHVHRSAIATGWPLTRWLRRFRADPLRRLRLGNPEAAARSSLPAPSPLQMAGIDTALRAVTDASAGRLPEPWPGLVRNRLVANRDSLAEELDRAVATTSLESTRPPLWWKVVGALQWLLIAVAVAGFLWLLALFAFGYLQLPEPSTPSWGRVPVPTLLLIVGLVAGLVLGVLARLFAHIGAGRRRRRARRHLTEQVRRVAVEQVKVPIEEELAAHAELCSALEALLR
jgi:GTP-binding protein EngB required for normal cell division